jgi:glycosyltransferase involved in cell wall biosynthesis
VQPPSIAYLYPDPKHLKIERASTIRARLTIRALRHVVQVHELAMVGAPNWVESPSVEPSISHEKDRRPTRLGLWHFSRRALVFLEEIRPQIIHAITTHAIAPSLVFKHRHPETRVVFEMHALAYLELRNDLLRRRLTSGLLDYLGARRADHIVAMSHTQRELLKKWFRVRPEKVLVSWGPVDMDLFRYQDPSPSPPFLVGYSGGDEFWHGLNTILEAARILQYDEEIRFLLMGFPSEQYVGLGLTNVAFFDALPREEVVGHLSRCHLTLSPTKGGRVTDSQYPFKLSAYLASGRPVVATSASDQPLVLKQADSGFVVPPNDSRALAEAILRVKSMEEDKRLELGQNARRFAERNLSLNKLADDLLDIYHSLLS